METEQSMSDSQGPRAFYLPGMSVLSSVPGRIERFLTSRLGDHSHPVVGPVPTIPSRPFYLPGTAVLSNVPGRVERTVTRLLRNRDTRARIDQLRQEIREFYLPGTPRFAGNRK